jgi:hypothetical protein
LLLHVLLLIDCLQLVYLVMKWLAACVLVLDLVLWFSIDELVAVQA